MKSQEVSAPNSIGIWLKNQFSCGGGSENPLPWEIGLIQGSKYKDLQIQMYGLWGEIRDWKDGTTIVQKTHDHHPDHVE